MRFRKQLALLSIIGFWILGPMSSYASWEELPIPSGGAIVADLQFIDDQEGWALLSSASLLHTEDGGESWTKIETSIPARIGTHGPIGRLHFTSSTHGWLVPGYESSGKELLRTTDGGQTWEEIEHPFTRQLCAGAFLRFRSGLDYREDL